MRRLALISLTVSGIVLALFGMNMLLFMMAPAYHDALTHAVTKDADIPTVVIDENKDPVVIFDVETSVTNDMDIEAKDLTIEDEEIPLSGNPDPDCEKRIIEKTYYEDCGSEKGYWIIKYEDGTTSIEQ